MKKRIISEIRFRFRPLPTEFQANDLAFYEQPGRTSAAIRRSLGDCQKPILMPLKTRRTKCMITLKYYDSPCLNEERRSLDQEDVGLLDLSQSGGKANHPFGIDALPDFNAITPG